MGPGFRFVLIAIALRAGFVSANNFWERDKCPSLSQYQKDLVWMVRYEVSEINDQVCSPNYWPNLLEKLYNKYRDLVIKSESQHKIIRDLKSYKTQCNELSQLKTHRIDLLEVQRQTAHQFGRIMLPASNEDLQACKSKVGQKFAIISDLEDQLKTCNNTYNKNEELRKELQSKIEEAQACRERRLNEPIPFPDYLMEESKTSRCDNFTNTTGIQPHVFTWMGQERAFCDRQLKGPGWMVIQTRTDGRTNFYREWSEYVKGFGDLSAEYFIGLENLHHFTTKFAPCELLIQLEDFEGETRYARYDNFKVGDEDSSYELKSLGRYSGNAGDALSYNLHSMFATSDRDSEDECAQLKVGAWWYSESCGFSNLNGVYSSWGNQDFDNDGSGIFWRDVEWHDFDYSMKSVKMMIRKRVN